MSVFAALLAAEAKKDPSEILCFVLVVAIIAFLVVAVLQLLNIVGTRATWWAWLIAAGIGYLGYYLFC